MRKQMLLVITGMLIGSGGCGELMRQQQEEREARYQETRIRIDAQNARSEAAFKEKYMAYVAKIEAVKLGMRFTEVVEIMGSPSDINTTEGIGYVHDQVVYREKYRPQVYFYFEEYVLTSIQK